MSCSTIRSILDDYLDHDLAAEQRERLERHLDDCAECRAELEAMQSLLRAAGRLPRSVEPPADLWPAIESRMQRTREQTGFGWSHLAAAVIALVLLSIPFSVWWASRPANAPTAAAPVEAAPEGTSIQASLARSEDGVLLARTDLVTAVERQRDVLEEATWAVFEENMELLDRAIGELRTALDHDPQNLRLRMLLAARYQQERKLLQKINRV